MCWLAPLEQIPALWAVAVRGVMASGEEPVVARGEGGEGAGSLRCQTQIDACVATTALCSSSQGVTKLGLGYNR